MPPVAASGQGGAGEILALYPLFAEFSTGFELEVKERGSLINGSPCAAALVADAALAARRRMRLALMTFALSIEAFRAPLEHYDQALDGLWGDKDEAAALKGLRGFLVGAGEGRRNYQAPVSYRIVPRVLGHAHRALVAAEHAANVSLSSISDNPVYIPPDEVHPYGRCISTGGYHNAMAAPALDDLAAIWADICLLCDRHSAKLLNGRCSQLPDMLLVGRGSGESDGRGHIGYVPMAVAGYIELAKSAAQRTFIPGSDSAAAGQDDVASPVFLAWGKEERAGRCVDASLAMLAVIASQALYVTNREAPPALRGFTEMVRSPCAAADRGPRARPRTRPARRCVHHAGVRRDGRHRTGARSGVGWVERSETHRAANDGFRSALRHPTTGRMNTLAALRRRATALENAVLDEFLAGRVDRRSFLRHAGVMGLVLPVAPALRAAPMPAGRTLTVGMPVPSGQIDPLTVGDTGGICMLSQVGEYLAVSDPDLQLRPVLGGKLDT